MGAQTFVQEGSEFYYLFFVDIPLTQLNMESFLLFFVEEFLIRTDYLSMVSSAQNEFFMLTFALI